MQQCSYLLPHPVHNRTMFVCFTTVLYMIGIHAWEMKWKYEINYEVKNVLQARLRNLVIESSQILVISARCFLLSIFSSGKPAAPQMMHTQCPEKKWNLFVISYNFVTLILTGFTIFHCWKAHEISNKVQIIHSTQPLLRCYTTLGIRKYKFDHWKWGTKIVLRPG